MRPLPAVSAAVTCGKVRSRLCRPPVSSQLNTGEILDLCPVSEFIHCAQLPLAAASGTTFLVFLFTPHWASEHREVVFSGLVWRELKLGALHGHRGEISASSLEELAARQSPLGGFSCAKCKIRLAVRRQLVRTNNTPCEQLDDKPYVIQAYCTAKG